MSFVRNILRDLVEKRLWPVALLMVVAIVAIPVLGGGSSSSTADEALPTAPGAAANASSAVELLGPPSVRKRAGKVVDPFRRAKKKDETTTTPAAAGGSAAGGSAGETTASPGAGQSGSAPKPAPSLFVYRTSVRFGLSGNSTKMRQISRLTPLGHLLNPALQYLGVDKAGKHALFLLGPDATSDGEANCRAAKCRIIALAPGDSQVVDLDPLASATQQFELTLVAIKRDKLSSASKAAKARAHVHPDGPDVLRLIAEDPETGEAITGFGYDRSRGVVVQTGG